MYVHVLLLIKFSHLRELRIQVRNKKHAKSLPPPKKNATRLGGGREFADLTTRFPYPEEVRLFYYESARGIVGTLGDPNH